MAWGRWTWAAVALAVAGRGVVTGVQVEAAPELPEPRRPWSVRAAIAPGTDAARPHWPREVPPLRDAGEGDTVHARGERLAMTTCIECHGFPLGGRELPRMSGVARGRYAAFTEGELADLWAFLRKAAEPRKSPAGR
jgi:cytochrome c553